MKKVITATLLSLLSVASVAQAKDVNIVNQNQWIDESKTSTIFDFGEKGVEIYSANLSFDTVGDNRLYINHEAFDANLNRKSTCNPADFEEFDGVDTHYNRTKVLILNKTPVKFIEFCGQASENKYVHYFTPTTDKGKAFVISAFKKSYQVLVEFGSKEKVYLDARGFTKAYKMKGIDAL